MSCSVRLCRVIALLAGVAALGGCEGEPDDPFFFFGTARNSQGAPVAGVPIELLRGKDAACWWSFRERIPPGPVPDGGQPLELFEQTTTDPDGLFLFEVLRYQQESGYCFLAETTAATGAKTFVWFSFSDTDVQADHFVFWADGTVDVSAAADGHTVQSGGAPLPNQEPVEGAVADVVAYEWDVTAGGEPVWRQERTAAPIALDSYLREDFGDVDVKVDMLAQLVSGGAAGGVGPMPTGANYAEYASGTPTAIPAATSRVPASRGAACAFGDPCPLTDGKLELVTLFDPRNPVPPPLELTLAAPIRPSLLIIRDLQLWGSGLVQVEGSTDGTTWRQLSEFRVGPLLDPGSIPQMRAYDALAGPVYFVRQPLTPPTEGVTHLRLSGPMMNGVREISFFE